MAQTRRDDRLKQGLLLTFVGAGLLLVALIWADGLRAGGEALPSYYRSAPDGGNSRSVAVTRFPEPDGGSTPGAADHDGEGHGGGHGAGGGEARPTATPLPESGEEYPVLPSLDGDNA